MSRIENFNFYNKLLVPSDKKIKIANYDPDKTFGLEKNEDVKETTEKNIKNLINLQYLLYAENKHALLIVLQGMDTSGKDGTIKHVMSGINPQGCQVTSFKSPTSEELTHDFLWRIHNKIPPKGYIGIFNRSQYEDVLIARVASLVPKDVWQARYEQINNFEQSLSENNVEILKFFLHISKEEQKERLIERLNDPSKNWKFSPSDLEVRKYWDEYMKAYEDILNKCSTKWAPWFVIPADNKWFRNLSVSQIVVDKLKSLNMKMPKSTIDLSKIEVK